ncbi:MAG: hypothetical protein Q7S11_03945 [bacterium]|nr:hypothetical protein [bacterium]
MNIPTSLRTLLLAIILSIGISYTYATWAPPTATPTGGNTDAPINVGGVTQVKAGALTVNGLLTAVSNVVVGGNIATPTLCLSGDCKSAWPVVSGAAVTKTIQVYQCPQLTGCSAINQCLGQLSANSSCQYCIGDTRSCDPKGYLMQ